MGICMSCMAGGMLKRKVLAAPHHIRQRQLAACQPVSQKPSRAISLMLAGCSGSCRLCHPPYYVPYENSCYSQLKSTPCNHWHSLLLLAGTMQLAHPQCCCCVQVPWSSSAQGQLTTSQVRACVATTQRYYRPSRSHIAAVSMTGWPLEEPCFCTGQFAWPVQAVTHWLTAAWFHLLGLLGCGTADSRLHDCWYTVLQL